MKISAIISEFDPFHFGHMHLVNKVREQGITHIVAIMSGNFTQRGTPAIMSKRARTRAALECGVDLVIEIPVIWCCSPAEKYAFAGVFTADSLGCVDTLSFACESGSIEELESVRDIVLSEPFKKKLKSASKSGITLAKSYSVALNESADPGIRRFFDYPNNILSLEYIKALRLTGSSIEPFTVKRIGAGHDSSIICNGIASASHIRQLIKEGSDFSGFVPKESYKIIRDEIEITNGPADIGNADRAALYKLRTMTTENIKNISQVTEGIENRIAKCAKSAESTDDLYFSIKTKRYTMSGIRRIILCCLLNITKELAGCDIPYIRVLGIGGKGSEILKKAANTAKLPIVTKYSDVRNAGENASKVFYTECTASDIYGLMLPKIIPCGAEQSYKIVTNFS